MQKPVDILRSMCYTLVTPNKTRGHKSIEGKRKTFTSSEVKERYNKKTYTRYQLTLRKVEDAELIERIEEEKAKGFSTSEAIKNLIK